METKELRLLLLILLSLFRGQSEAHVHVSG